MGERVSGKVKMLEPKKGFGFIRVDGTTDDVFMHLSALPQGEFARLKEDDPLTFVIDHDAPKGPRALEIQRA